MMRGNGAQVAVAIAGWGDQGKDFAACAADTGDDCLDFGTVGALDMARILDSRPGVFAIKSTAGSEELLALVDQLVSAGVNAACPVVLYVPGAADPSLVRRIVAHGIHHVLPNEMSVAAIWSILKAVNISGGQVRKLQSEVETRSSAIGYIRSGEFEIRTIPEARNLSTMLSLACPDPRTAALGLFEMLVNGVEHGILQLGYHRKTELLAGGNYLQDIAELLARPEYADSTVIVKFRRDSDRVVFHIIDPGPGFDPEPYYEFSAERAMDTHGRGIAMSKHAGFDNMTYAGKGNEVICEFML